MSTARQKPELPPLPEPEQTAYVTDSVMRKLEVRNYTANQMHAYARAALAAQQAEPMAPPPAPAGDAIAHGIGAPAEAKPALTDGEIYRIWRDTKTIYEFAYAILAAAPGAQP